MADACAGFNDGHFGIVAHKLNERLAAARDNQIDILDGLQKGGGGGVIVGHQQGGVRVETKVSQFCLDDLHGCQIGVFGIFSTFQHACVVAAQTERKNIESDVGTRFVNNADDAERNTHFLDSHAVGPLCFAQQFSYGRRQSGYFSHIFGNATKAAFR